LFISLFSYICLTIKTETMDEVIEILEQINNDFYKGHYTVGERFDLIQEIKEVLKRQQFI
jgi:hypothetical protein